MIPRYETEAMRALWSAKAQFSRWTQVEVAACQAWHDRGEIPDAEMDAILAGAKTPDPARVREIEAETNHDVVAFVRALAEHVGEPASRHLHRGLTSSDVVDTALAIAMEQSLQRILQQTHRLRKTIARQAYAHRATPCIGRTHGIHAEPTTFGARLAGWITEIDRNIERLQEAHTQARHAKLSGAVGTFSQTDPKFEAYVLERLGLVAEPVATQVVPRDRHAQIMAALALMGGAIERFATDIRALQRTDLREVEEPFAKGQTGSSAMPHKRNPITSERMCGMARLLRSYMMCAFENTALWHERDISHSSAERVAIPDAFHLLDYMLDRFEGVMAELRVYPDAMMENLNKTRGLVFSQNVLGVMLAKGMDRHVAYRIVQRGAMQVWEKTASSFREALLADPEAKALLSASDLDQAFDLSAYQKHVPALMERAKIGPDA